MKILVSGCSYSIVPPNYSYSYFLEKNFGYNVTNVASPGQSNSAIIKKIYDYITEHKITNSLIVCQYTHLHRIGMYTDVLKKWIDYQPYYMNTNSDGLKSVQNGIEILNNPKSINTSLKRLYTEWNKLYNISETTFTELILMYELYLKNVFNEMKEFEQLMLNTDLLTEWIKAMCNDVLFIYWPELNNEYQKIELNKRNFFNIEGEYSMLKWTIDSNNLLNKTNLHLTSKGNKIFANQLYKIIEKHAG
jgi:hypothetical protein